MARPFRILTPVDTKEGQGGSLLKSMALRRSRSARNRAMKNASVARLWKRKNPTSGLGEMGFSYLPIPSHPLPKGYRVTGGLRMI
jgi:hypothetical protein